MSVKQQFMSNLISIIHTNFTFVGIAMLDHSPVPIGVLFDKYIKEICLTLSVT